MTDSPNPADVARWLADHPDFFETHGHALVGLRVPSPHGVKAISLHERQLEVMRERHRALEHRLADLIRIGQENDAIVERMQRWSRQLLLAPDAAALPDAVLEGMRTIFSVPQVALRLWGVREAHRGLACAEPADAEAQALADAMQLPYCGPNADIAVAAWLPEGGVNTRSIALLPLRRGASPGAFGLLVLGSADPARFDAGMGTAFLERIAELASAALSRLVETV